MKHWSFSLLTTLMVLLSVKVFPAQARFKCNKKIDLAIVLDSSASMGEKNFAKAKSFANDLLDYFDVSPEATHVSLSYFSFYTHLITRFDDDVSPRDMKEKIKAMKFEGSFTNLAATSEGIRYKVFSKERGARKGQIDSKMVAVFLSDAFDTFGSEELKFYIKELHGHGVETFIGKIDGKYSKKGIKSLVSKERKDHEFTMYDDEMKRKTESENMAKSICTFRKDVKLPEEDQV